MKISLTQKKFALVDEADAHLAEHKWQYNDTKGDGNGYAVRDTKVYEKFRRLYMHRVIMGAKDGELIRHRNGNNLDNRRRNLIKVTHSQRATQARSSPGATGYRGVYAVNGTDTFRALITVGGKTMQIGTFAAASAAARMYDVAAREFYGDFAVLNFPNATPSMSLREAMDEHKRAQARERFEAGERTTPYIGVNARSPHRFRATIQVNGKQRFIGGFDDAIAAARAYDAEARKLYGPNAFVNFPSGDSP